MRDGIMNFILAGLWFICVVVDIVSMMQGGSPTWLSLILANICLVFNNIELGISKR